MGFSDISVFLKQKDEESIVLFGGEPTLRNDLQEIVTAAVRSGYRRIKLSTNGRAFSDGGSLKRLVDAGCRLFEIELWGSNPSLHDFMTQSAGSFWETVSGLENLAQIPDDRFLSIRIPVCKENYSDTENTVVTAMNFGANRIVLSLRDCHTPLQSLLPHIRNAINISIFNRMWILTEGMPLCVMQGVEEHVSEIYNGWDALFERTFRIHKYCGECVYGDLCPGIDAAYLDTFGEKEFMPVSAGRHVSGIRALYE